MKLRTLQWINTISFAVMMLVNILANLIPLGVGDTAYISQKYPSLFTPAEFTFSIWAVIYILMIGFVLYQWGIIDDRSDRAVMAIGPLFTVSCALNTAWIFAWHYDLIWLSVLLIVGLLIVLVNIKGTLDGVKKYGAFREVVDIGFDVYLGWIIAATLANISVYLVSLGWNAFGTSEIIWTCVVLIVGALIGSLPTTLDGRVFATAAVMWAYFGIMMKHVVVSGHDSEYPAIIICGAIGEVIMLITIMLYLTQKGPYQDISRSDVI